MTYQIVRQIPHYGSRDEVTGWSFKRYPNAYETAALAFKFCEIDADLYDGDLFVINYGGDVHKDRVWNFSRDPETIAACAILDNWF